MLILAAAKFVFQISITATAIGVALLVIKLLTSTAWFKEWWYNLTKPRTKPSAETEPETEKENHV